MRNKSRDFDHSMSQFGTGIRGPSGRSRMHTRSVRRGIKASSFVLIPVLRIQNASRLDPTDGHLRRTIALVAPRRSMALREGGTARGGIAIRRLRLIQETPYTPHSLESVGFRLPTVRRMKAKLVMMGESGVGKTSLVRRFVSNEYQSDYIRTVGTRVSKVELEVPHGSDFVVHMDLAIFDLGAEKGFRDLVKETYYHGAHALMAVADLGQKESLLALSEWIPAGLEIAGDVPVYLVLNKKDLDAKRAISDEEVRKFAEKLPAPYVYTSAQTGESVEDAFNAMAIEIVDRAFRAEKVRAAAPGLQGRILELLEKRGALGLKKHQFFEILRGVKSDEIQAELDRLEGEGLVTIMWYGAADFGAALTPRGVRAVKQRAEWDEE
jgi:small GTP-binding protein